MRGGIGDPDPVEARAPVGCGGGEAGEEVFDRLGGPSGAEGYGVVVVVAWRWRGGGFLRNGKGTGAGVVVEPPGGDVKVIYAGLEGGDGLFVAYGGC